MMGGFGMGFGFIGMIIFWVVLIAAVYLIIRSINNTPKNHKGNSQSSMEILKKRYASGEITKDEFERMKQEIS